MVFAVYNSPPGGSHSLPANTVEKIVGVQLNTGNNVSQFWTVFGKVVVDNSTNSQPVKVQAQLVVPGSLTPLLDTSIATIPANGLGSIPLEGVPAQTDAAMCVEIHCKAFPPGATPGAEYARLIAISVDRASPLTC
jgi:hypothetical protein